MAYQYAAESTHIKVDNTNYCWMVCEYNVSGLSMEYNLYFHFDKGCAQLDNAWIKLGGAVVWQNTGRIHNYEGKLTYAHNVSIHSGSCTLAYGSNSFTFGITKYSGSPTSGAFTITVSPPPPVSNTKLYGSVNGRARKIKKLYCSVSNQTRKIKKLYAGDANGNAKLIYEDNT